MPSLNDQIRFRVEAFVSELEGLIREAALQSISEALGGKSVTHRRPVPASRPTRSEAEPRQSGGKKARIRRSLSQLAAVADRIHAYVSENPGKRGEEIKSALKIGTKEWARPIQMLVESGRVSTKGEKRATAYFAKR
jgi:hypothetical protein